MDTVGVVQLNSTSVWNMDIPFILYLCSYSVFFTFAFSLKGSSQTCRFLVILHPVETVSDMFLQYEKNCVFLQMCDYCIQINQTSINMLVLLNIMLQVIREIQEKSLNSLLWSLSCTAVLLFLLPWHWLIHSPHFSQAFPSPDSVTITSLSSTQPWAASGTLDSPVSTAVPSAGTRLGVNPLGLSVTEQNAGQVRWRGEK